MTGILKVDVVQDVDGNDIIQESSGTVTLGQSAKRLPLQVVLPYRYLR